MFGLVRQNEGADETRQPGFIKRATLFTTKETQINIDRLEKESKEMAKNFGGGHLLEDSQEDNEAHQPKQKVLYRGETNFTEGKAFETKPEALGPLERRTKNNLCERALSDYAMVEKFNWEKFDNIDIL